MADFRAGGLVVIILKGLNVCQRFTLLVASITLL